MGNPSQNRNEATRKKIQEWLLVRFEHVKESTSPDTIWHLIAENSNGFGLDVGQLRAKPDLIAITARIVVMADYRDSLASMPQSERWQFLREIQLYLLPMDVDFSGIKDPLEDIVILSLVPIETLGRDTFLQRLARVDRAALALMVMLDHKLATNRPLSEITNSPTIN